MRKDTKDPFRFTMRDDRNGEIVILNPDAKLSLHIADRIAEACRQELADFMEECRVAIRTMPPGEMKVIQSRPIVVTIASPQSEPVESEARPAPGVE